MGATLKNAALRRPELTEMYSEAADLQDMFIGEELFPVVTEPTETGIYYKRTITGGGLMRAANMTREARGAYQRSDRKFESDAFRTFEYGEEEPLDEKEMARFDDLFDAEADAGTNLARALKLGHEIRVKNKMFTPASWTLGTTSPVVAYTESLLSTIDFVRDITNRIEDLHNYGVVPNCLVLSSVLWNLIRRTPKLQSYIFGPTGSANQQRQISEADVSALFDMPLKLKIAKVPVDLSAVGDESPNIERVWPTTYMWLGKVVGGRYKAGGAGRTIVWDADSPGGLLTTETYEEPNIRSRVVRVRMNTDEKVVDSTTGSLITTGYSPS
jgi:hypothetical protein